MTSLADVRPRQRHQRLATRRGEGLRERGVILSGDVMEVRDTRARSRVTVALVLWFATGWVAETADGCIEGGASGEKAKQMTGVENMDAETQAIARQRAGWIAAINAGSAEEFASYLADDAVWLPWGQEAIQGKQRIKNWLEHPFAEYVYDYSVFDVRLRLAGGWAVERSGFRTEAETRAGEKAPIHEGTYTVLWRRTPDGVWLIERYIDHTEEHPPSVD